MGAGHGGVGVTDSLSLGGRRRGDVPARWPGSVVRVEGQDLGELLQ